MYVERAEWLVVQRYGGSVGRKEGVDVEELLMSSIL